jgi:hypothetical protein
VIATPQEVKRAFILGNQLKADWDDSELFKQQMIHHSERLTTLSESELDGLIHDKHRLKGYQSGEWESGLVDLAHCRVWKHMGGKAYMNGSVPEACSAYEKMGRTCAKLNKMILTATAGLFLSLPIIVFRRKSSGGFRIDDGNHRAVASCLADIRQIKCYIGTVPSCYNHNW